MACKSEPKGSKPFLPGLCKLEVLWQGTVPSPINAANVLHGRWSDNINHPLLDLAQAISNFKNFFSTNILPSISSGYKIIGWRLQSLGGDGLVETLTDSNAGSASSLPLPPQSAVCISWLTGITARGGRGRTYLPGIPGSATLQLGSPVLTQPYSAGLKSSALAFVNSMATAAVNGQFLNIGIPSYYNKCQFRPTPLFFPILGVAVHERVDSQRRRSGKESTFPVV